MPPMLPEHARLIQPQLRPGEEVHGTFATVREGKDDAGGILAITSSRLLAYDRRFEGRETSAFITIPFHQVVATALEPPARRGARQGSTAATDLLVITAAGSQRFALRLAEHARAAQDLLLEKVLTPSAATSGSVASWVAVLRACEMVMSRVDPSFSLTAPGELMAQARVAAQTGQDPSQALADVLADVGLLEERA